MYPAEYTHYIYPHKDILLRKPTIILKMAAITFFNYQEYYFKVSKFLTYVILKYFKDGML